jgi:hypothetical protein
MTNQNKTRDSFIFYRSFFSATKHLNQVEKAQLFEAICSYALDGNISLLEGTPQGMFELIKPQLDANRKRFENGCKKKQKISKTEAKPKQKTSKEEANVNVNVNVNHNEECKSESESELKSKITINPIYKKLSDGLLFILEAKLQRKLSSKNWEDEIKKLIEKDLSVRQNPIEDVKQAIQTIANNYGKEYFPVIQSAKSLREKFTKIEDYVKRNSQGKNNQSSALDQYNSILNDLNGDFNE